MTAPMNRETKRLLTRQGKMNPDGSMARRERAPVPTKAPDKERVSPIEFVGQVRGELRKVAWPTRPEVINYTGVVLVTLVFMGLITFSFDFFFAHVVLWVFDR